MDLKALKTFKLIASTGSFLRAAEELCYAQSTVTMQIKKLEEDLGVKLFDRGKRIQLTEAGHVLLKEATPLLMSVESLRYKISAFEHGEAGIIKMGSIEPAASFMLRSIISPFLNERPKVQFELEVGNTKTISKLVSKGELDFSVSPAPPPEEDLLFMPWFEETLGLLMPENHSLTNKKQIEISDLQNERLLFPGRNLACRNVLETHLMKGGNNHYSGLVIGNTETLKKAVKNNLGIAFVPVISDEPDFEGAVLRQVHGMHLSYPIGLVQRKDKVFGSPLIELLTNLKSELSSLNPPWKLH